MTTPNKLVHANDESEPAPAAVLAGGLDLSSLIGQWKNTNTDTRGISGIVISEGGEGLRVRVFGARREGPIDWGERPATTYAYGVAGDIVAGLELTYEFGPQDTLVTAIHNRGVLVIHAYHRFNDGRGRSNFISKEFFHQ
jgi:hypothetical protein